MMEMKSAVVEVCRSMVRNGGLDYIVFNADVISCEDTLASGFGMVVSSIMYNLGIDTILNEEQITEVYESACADLVNEYGKQNILH